MERENLNFVIVGHVDHGKSTLIGRLLHDTDSLPAEKMAEVERVSNDLGRGVELAFLMDHLQEERDLGITIDTAQTFFRTARRNYVIIDAPGHKELIKNMITGAAQAEAAILIIDAAEGVREQSRRHAYLLGMLGLNQVAVVINKMDKVAFAQERFAEVAGEIREFLDAIGIAPMQTVPISAKQGDNVALASERMNWYSGPTVLEALHSFKKPPSPDEKPLRLPVQDVYKIGDKRMLVGRVESGMVRTGQEIAFHPSGARSKITSIELFQKPPLDTASVGQSIGFTLEDALFIERGQIACPPDVPARVSDTIRANVFWMNPRPLEAGERLKIRLSTQEVGAAASSIARRIDPSSLEVIGENAAELKNNEIGELTITTKKPIAMETFQDVPELGRFVLVRDHDIAGGGIISH
jgi:sulfate adenylyltransferase large subunit